MWAILALNVIEIVYSLGTKARACTNFDSDVTIQSVSAKNLGDTWRVRVFTEKACGGTGENIDHTQDICIKPGIWKDQNEWKSYKIWKLTTFKVVKI
ncbi:uncharacterized protein N7483_007849 [Penicillium malachiteum]|uniref:uncharacterized protein n=1 Tax=Penicillium malachiteum TaxID=1324776 RepID=UPI0025474790|nr:uncharacterized protein N7483_007849 [Penicillium malachiteum]KAJ5726492.1 hypothetical protein N7483_007849 [Penicillium malachiteum]